MTGFSHIFTKTPTALSACRWLVVAIVATAGLVIASCEREPRLYLHYDGAEIEYEIPEIEFALDIYWDYELDYGIQYDWRAEWFYGTDPTLFDQIGYTKPEHFELRRYHTDNVPYGKHTNVEAFPVSGTRFSRTFDWGYWDILIWNEIQGDDQGIQSLHPQETLDSVVFTTNPSPFPSRYQAPRQTRSYFQPEELFSAYTQAEYIDPELKDFIYDAERNIYIRKDSIDLHPATYIYLTQVILHNNRGRVTGVTPDANLSGMANSVNINTGISGLTPVTTYYNVNFKPGIDILRKGKAATENVDIIGGRLLTFGLCGIDGSRVSVPKRGRSRYPDGTILGITSTGQEVYTKDNETHIDDGYRHYMDVTMKFVNKNDSTFVFDVTDQVRRRWKGGVITVELDMDTVSIPSKSGGSGFDAVVEDYVEEVIPEFEFKD